jgi:monofunctional biosynthetic peptidoglycan transglycosylase
MLDQKPDRPSDEGDSPRAPDATNRAADASAGGSGGGAGMLGRFRAGIAGQPGMEGKPLWRLLLVFLLKWGAIAIAAFLVLSSTAVFAIGWTGPPPTFNMAGKAMEGVEVRRSWVALKDVSPHLVRAVIAAEDQNFCLHDGFDRKQIAKALEEAERGRDLRGASTISQQTAKNVFLFNGGGWVRKGFEAYFTVLVETMWSKPRIMEIYLNVAEWGDGIYGVERASQERFGVSAKNLTARQAALLAAVLPSPNRWKVTGNYAGSRAGQIMTLMAVVRRDDLDVCVVKR